MVSTEQTAVRDGRRGRRRGVRTWLSICDGATEGLLVVGILFLPWAFGTTQDWAIRLMNGVAYTLGGLYLLRRLLERWGHAPVARWTDGATGSWRDQAGRGIERAMAVLTVLILGYVLVSAVNARATVLRPSWTLEYREFIAWLPHSYDQERTWKAFWVYLAWACLFWSAKDWLTGLSRREARDRQEAVLAGRTVETADQAGPWRVPDRLRRLLYVLCLNGSLLAAQGLIQRTSGSNQLLWMVEPRYNKTAESQFGPYAYRSNAAQYLNLIGPLCVALAWIQGRARRHARRHGLRWRGVRAGWWVAGAVLMGAAPFISLSRGGALVTSGLILVVGTLVTLANHGRRWVQHLGLVMLTAVTVQIAIVAGFDRLLDRFETLFVDDLSGRLQVHENTRRMAQDHPWFGTGPGSFAALYQFYRPSASDAWEAFAHNDWLELRVTFGWIGFGLVLALLLALPLRWYLGAGPPVPWLLPLTILCALAGCLVHARFDLPFGIYSISATFLLLAALLVACAGHPTSTNRNGRGYPT